MTRMMACALAIASVAGCAKTFYCEQTGAEGTGPRYCYKEAAMCGSHDRDVLTNKPRDVQCVERHEAYCRADPDEDRVCAWSKGDCVASIPRGLEDTRSGRPPDCDWVR